MGSKAAQKVKLPSFDELLGTGEPESKESIVMVPIRLFHSFKGHPFQVSDDEKMEEIVESIRKYGVLVPGIVRPQGENGYEVVAGHRRWRACELAGVEEMPVIIRELDDDAATIIMVDSNVQRENILPSEKAFAYKMKYEAIRHQGSRGDKHTADEVGEVAGDSGRTVQRYIRLTELNPCLLDYVDTNKIPLLAGEKLSYLKKEEQNWVDGVIKNSGVYPSKTQAEQLKLYSEQGKLTEGQVYAVLIKKEGKGISIAIPSGKIREYFPVFYTKEQMEEVIYTLLERWKQNEEKEG